MEYHVYILFSSISGKYYVGQTNHLESRLARHNAVFVKSTKKYLPWQLVLSYKCYSRSEAMQLESKIKKRGITRFLHDTKYFGM
jgi:putative endonuclease